MPRVLPAALAVLAVLALALAMTLATTLASLPALAAEDDTFTLTIRNHKFQPERLEVPAGKRITLVVKNEDATPEEFESHDMKLEKVIPGGTSAKLRVGPLKPGEYKFVGEFNEASAKGVLVAK
jgi:plastocyanin